MKILVFSDSHGRDEWMRDAMSHFPSADAYIHLGDGTAEFLALQSEFPAVAFLAVLGNGEGYFPSRRQAFNGIREEETVTLDGIKIFFTHGHRYGVKGGESNLAYRAMELEADLALFGHTHQPFHSTVEKADGKKLHLLNPGSIGRPNYGEKPSFGLIEIKNGRLTAITTV